MTARKPLLSLVCCLALGALVACGDSSGSSSSGNGGSNGSYKESVKVDGDTVRYTAEITLKVLSHDADARELAIGAFHQSYCVLDGESVDWRIVREDPDTTRVTYRFEELPESAVEALERAGHTVKDGIAMIVDDGEDETVYVGRDSSSAFGEWQGTSCMAMAGRGIYCDDDVYTGSVVRISNSSVFVKEIFLMDKADYAYDEPFRSYFASMLYERLASPFDYPFSAMMMFYEDTIGVADAIDDLGVEITKQTEKSQTFMIGGRSYTVNIQKRDWSFRGSDVEYSVDVEVVGATETCRITARTISGVDEGNCADKYQENYDWDDDEDVDGNTFVYASGMSWNNDDEYLPCLERLAGAPAPAAAVAKAVRRTAANKIQVRPAKKRLFAR